MSRAQAATSTVRLLQVSSAPSSMAIAHFSLLPAVASTVAPACLAHCMAATETPLPAACISTVSPALSPPILEQGVVRGHPAGGEDDGMAPRHAVGNRIQVGLRRQAFFRVSAGDGAADDPENDRTGRPCPPVLNRSGTSDMDGLTSTRSPGLTPVTPEPVSTTVPATSRPEMCGRLNPGMVNQPLRCATSRRFIVVAATWMIASRGPGSGSGHVPVLQHLRTAMLIIDQRFHSAFSPSGSKATGDRFQICPHSCMPGNI